MTEDVTKLTGVNTSVTADHEYRRSRMNSTMNSPERSSRTVGPVSSTSITETHKLTLKMTNPNQL